MNKICSFEKSVSVSEMFAKESAFRFFIIDFFEFLTTSQSFPLIMEANLCRNIPDYLQSYIVRQREVNKKSLSENCQN